MAKQEWNSFSIS